MGMIKARHAFKTNDGKAMERNFTASVFAGIPSVTIYDQEAEAMVRFPNGGWICVEGCEGTKRTPLTPEKPPASLKPTPAPKTPKADAPKTRKRRTPAK